MPRNAGLPMKKYSDGTPKVVQHIIGELDVSYNPDDSRFYVSQLSDLKAIATFAGNPKGYYNALQFAKQKRILTQTN